PLPGATADAAAAALTAFPDATEWEDGDIVVLPGDTPLLRATTLAALVREHRTSDAACTVLSARLVHPGGHDRVMRDKDTRVSRIVEHALATEEERGLEEVNTSIYCFRRTLQAPALR